MTACAWLLGVSLLMQIPAVDPDVAATRMAELQARRTAIETKERAALRELADQLRAKGDAVGADEVAALAAPPEARNSATRFVPLPELVPATSAGRGLPNMPAAAPEIQAGPARAVRAARTEAADKLVALAQSAVSAPPKVYSLADQCLRAALERQPNHPVARRLLGFVPHDGGWATPYAIGMLKKGYVPHPKYGWVLKTWVPHLEQGELPATTDRGQRWFPAAEADRLHAPWEKAWKIETEHFMIRTNVPLSEAIAFSRQLEDFYQLFFSLLADVFAEKLPLAERLRGRAPSAKSEGKPHEVYYFASKEEFVEFLEPLQGPSIAGSLGLYIPIVRKEKRRPAYFFRDAGGQLPVTATLYHEVSHQLLFESGLGNPEAYLHNEGNYWVFEGLGTYFETLVRTASGALEVGGLVGGRVEAARGHLVENQEYIPLEEFVSYNQDRFNAGGSVHLHYQEAHALALFFMQADERKYREGFLEYVDDAFNGRVRRLSGRELKDRLGVPYRSLDAEFLAYLKGR